MTIPSYPWHWRLKKRIPSLAPVASILRRSMASKRFVDGLISFFNSSSILIIWQMDSANVTWQIASSPTARSTGANGTLPDSADSDFRAIDE